MARPAIQYLPALADLFEGRAQLIPWAQVAQSLRESKDGHLNPTIRTYLELQEVYQILQQSPSVIAGADEGSKKRFETATAAIHVSHEETGKNDISSFKEDALWLSQEMKINEIQALRLVLLEWQLRPFAYLDSGYSEAEVASLKEAFGEKADLRGLYPDGFSALRSESDFSSDNARRHRQVIQYFREKLGLLNVLSILTAAAIIRESNSITNFAKKLLPNLNQLGLHSHQHLIQIIRLYLQGPQWTINDPDLEQAWLAGHLLQISELMGLVLIWLRTSEQLDSSCLQQWVEVMTESAFLSQVEPNGVFPSQELQRLQLLVTLVTIAQLDPATTINQLNSQPAETWLHEFNLVGEVHTVLFNAAEGDMPQLSPAVLAWSLVLQNVRQHAVSAKEQREHQQTQKAVSQISAYDSATGRRASFASSGQQSIYEDIIDAAYTGSPVHDPTSYLLALSGETGSQVITEMAGFDDDRTLSFLKTLQVQTLQELLSIAFGTLGYREEFLASQLSLLECSNPSKYDRNVVELQTKFIENESLMTDVFEVAAARFPYESLTFLKLCKHLAQAKIFDKDGTQYIGFRLKALQSFAQVATGAFDAYRTIREDENLNLVTLEDNVNMLSQPEMKTIMNQRDESTEMILPADTTGEVISEAFPPVIRWYHEYNGLSLLGKWLELHYEGQLHLVLSQFEEPSDVVCEIISLLSTLVTTTVSQANIHEFSKFDTANDILNDASACLLSGVDVTHLIFNILEQELQSYRRRPSNVFDTSISTACLQYLAALIDIHPEQFWSLIGKTSVVNTQGGASLVVSIITGREVFSGSLDLIDAFVTLYRAVVNNVVIQYLGNASRGTGQQSASSDSSTMSRSRVLGLVQQGFTHAALDIFQMLEQPKMTPITKKNYLISYLSDCFCDAINNALGTGDPRSRLSSDDCLMKSVQVILDRLRSVYDTEYASSGPILQHIVAVADHTHLLMQIPSINDPVKSLANLANTLVHCGQFLSLEPSRLEIELLNAVPIFIRRFKPCQNEGTTEASLLLVKTTLDTLSSFKPVSLLGHLGSTSCITFVNVLKSLYGSHDWQCRHNVFDLLASLVSKDQQWLAVVILTGSAPDKSNDSQKSNKKIHRGLPFIDMALDLLSEVGQLEQSFASAVLRFVIAAQQNWSWTTSSLQSRQEVFTSLVAYVSRALLEASNPIIQSQHNRLAALVTELCAIHLHYAKSVRDTSVMKTLIPLLNWLTSNAVEVSSYNASMHTNLQKNFATKFGMPILTFKNSGFIKSSFGRDKFYLLELAGQIFCKDNAWSGNGKDVHQSFSAEIARANANLSVVESELLLLRSFQQLCIEHSGFFVQDTGIQRTMAHIIHNCLTANTRIYPSEVLFDNLNQIRMDMSLALIQQLVEVGAKGSDFRNLLTVAWDAAASRGVGYEQAIINDDLIYWRSTVSVIVLALQFHIGKSWQPLSADPSSTALLHHTEHSIPKILEVAKIVIGQGFTSIVTAIQDQRQNDSSRTNQNDAPRVKLRDIVVIVNALETILRMVRLPDFVTQLSEYLLSTNCIQASLALYSWSHLLSNSEVGNGLIYAEYSLRFLISLSSLPLVAEELAVEGLLSRLLTAKVTQALQRIPDGVSDLDSRPDHLIMYKLWAEGILPLCLNLLHLVGAPIAAETSFFIGQFPNQLNRASLTFAFANQNSKSEHITLSSAKEAATLTLISYMLESYRAAGASAAVESSSILHLPNYDEHRKSLHEDIQELTNMDRHILKAKILPTSEKELKWNKEDILVNRVRNELKSAAKCLQAEEVEEDKL